jgi:hypothetical protein
MSALPTTRLLARMMYLSTTFGILFWEGRVLVQREMECSPFLLVVETLRVSSLRIFKA